VFVPNSSSVIIISATLTALDVSVFTGKLVTVLARLTVGGLFVSVIVIDKGAVSSGVTPTEMSSTSTVTFRVELTAKSRLVAGARCNSVPTISNSAASGPLRLRVFVPRASSVITISATLIALERSWFTAKFVVALMSSTVGG